MYCLSLEIHAEQWTKAIWPINIDHWVWLWRHSTSLSDWSIRHVFWVDGKWRIFKWLILY